MKPKKENKTIVVLVLLSAIILLFTACAKEEPADQAQIVAENEAFKITAPAPDTEIDNRFTVRGQAKVFEATVQYVLEDGHFVLAEGFVTAAQGAPEWGDFTIDIEFSGAVSPVAMLTLFQESAEDGSRLHELKFPLNIKEENIVPKG